MNLLLLLRHQFEVTLVRIDCLVKIVSLLRSEGEHVVLCFLHLVLETFVFLTKGVQLGLIEEHVDPLRRHHDHFLLQVGHF